MHGTSTANAAVEVSQVLFGGTIIGLSDEAQTLLLNTAPTYTTSAGTEIIDILVATELASSKREARTFITSNAVSLGDNKISEETAVVTKEHFTNDIALLRRGKKQLCVLQLK